MTVSLTFRTEQDDPLTFEQVDGNFEALDTGKADTGHTHVPTEIVGSTSAGRAMLTAADAAAQTALLNTATTSLKGLMSDADKTKLDAITGTNTGDETAAGILTKIKTVDGDGTGLDADKLDGLDATAFALASHTQLAATISDSTSAGRAMLTAANAAAQTALLDAATTSLKGLLPAADKTKIDNWDFTAYALLKPQKFGALGDGSTNDITAINSWAAAAGAKYIPNGNYITSGSVTAFSRPQAIIADHAQRNGTYIPYLTIAGAGLTFDQLPKNHIFVQHYTSHRDDAQTIQIQRVVDNDIGQSNPKALRVKTIKQNSNAGAEWALSGELDSYSNTSATGDTATSGVANKYGTGQVFAGHFQANDFNVYGAATSVSGLVGAEMNLQAVGLDHPTGNSGFGYRRILDLIAKTNKSATDWDVNAGNNYGEAEIGTGLIIRNDDAGLGTFRYGLVIDDTTAPGASHPITTAMLVQTSGADGVQIKGANTSASLRIAPATPGAYGIRLTGAFTSGAIGIDSERYITFSTDGTRKFRYSAGTDGFEFLNGITRRAYIQVTSTPGLFLNDVKVVGTRDTGWTAMTGSTDKATSYATSTVTLAQLAGRVMAIQAALTTHGILGA